MAIPVPGERRHALARSHAKTLERAGELARTAMGVAVGIAMDRPLDRAGDDLLVAVVTIRVPDQRRDQKLGVHHQAVHRHPPGLSYMCIAASTPARDRARDACKARGGPLASTRSRRSGIRGGAFLAHDGDSRPLRLGGSMRIGSGKALTLALAAIIIAAGDAGAQVKIAFIDPLSGGAASAGTNAQKHLIYLIDKVNAGGGLNGEKLELISFDNKVDPQESLIALKKALDEGARYVFQGNGSSVALAITDAVLKYNERNPGKEVLYFNYAAVDPALTNDKCNFWHFRFDVDADMKMAGLTDAIAKDPKIKAIYLINQDYSFGRAVA